MRINGTKTICPTQDDNKRGATANVEQRFARKRVAPHLFGILRLAPVVAALLLSGIYGRAQSTSGRILGDLTDQSGAVISNAQLTLTNVATNYMRRSATNDLGYYQFVNIPPGVYQITATKQGFKTITREPINLQVEGSVQINLTMQVGNQSQKVTVTARTPLIQAQTDSLGAVIDQRETSEIPLNGRNPMNLAGLVPSVIPQGGAMSTPTGQKPFSWGNYQIGGSFANEGATFLDGAPMNSEYINMTTFVPTQDSLQAFKVDTNNLSPEFGHFAGGIINFRTKSGTNAFHGSLWEFLRNKVFNANTYFGNLNHLASPPFTQNQYGFNLGGPVYIPHLYNGRNKTFFFVNWEGFGLRQGQTYAETVPTADERTGNLSVLGAPIYDPNTTCGASPGVVCAPGETQYNRTQFNNATIPTNRLNPTALLYLQRFYPMPNVTGGSTGLNNYIANVSTGGNNYETVVHLDQNVSDRQHISARWTYWTNNAMAADPLGTGICQTRCADLFHVNDFVLNDTYSFNSTTILALSLSYLHFVYNRSPLLDTYSLTSLGMPESLASQVQFPGPPVMTISGFDTASTFSSEGADQKITAVTDNDHIYGSLTKFVGNHTLKFGGEYGRGTYNFAQNNISSGIYRFNNSFTAQNPLTGVGGLGLASFLLGYPYSGSIENVVKVAGEQLYPALYVNDDWRVISRLTLHLGLRWENDLPWTERHNRLSYFDTNTVNPILHAAGLGQYQGSSELVASGTRGSRYNINADWKQFSPRLGLSYGVTPNTVFSLGYGVFWVPNNIELSLEPSGDPINSFTTPYNASVDGGLTPANNISDPYPGGIVPAPGRDPSFQGILLGTGVSEAFPNNPYAYAQQWNVAVQRQIGESAVVDIAYAGSKGTHLEFYNGVNVNQLPDKDLALGNALLAGMPNPFHGVINSGYSLGAATIPAGQLLLKYPQYSSVSQAGAGFGNSTYNSLQVTAQKRFAAGASINVAYTWAKLLSNTDTLTSFLETEVSGIQDYNNLKGEKSLSSDDVRNNLILSYIYDVPIGRGKKLLSNASKPVDYVVGGWGLGGVTTLMSGFPLGFTTNQNLTNSFGGNSRPNYVPGCVKTVSGSAFSKRSRWFNTACFTQPPAFTFGDESRNDSKLRAPGEADWDISLFKNFPIGRHGKAYVQFRAEAFNLFNRVQFGYPGTVQGQAGFGVITSQANLPRVLQFSLRVNY